MKIIYGTTNKHKIEQVQSFFKVNNLDVELISLKDIGFDKEIIEDGETFEENSQIKAKAIKEFCEENNINELIITDDAGLCVNVLDGRPGVYSARYAGENATQLEIINKVLKEMENIPFEQRTATFVCVLTLVKLDGQTVVLRGETHGKIAEKPGPLGNLTYMPIFIPDGFNGRVMNELTEEELGDTHREKAFRKVIEILK